MSWRGRDKFGLPNWVPNASMIAGLLGVLIIPLGLVTHRPILTVMGFALMGVMAVFVVWAHWRYHQATGRWWFPKRSN
jgi:hypothetical protein